MKKMTLSFNLIVIICLLYVRCILIIELFILTDACSLLINKYTIVTQIGKFIFCISFCIFEHALCYTTTLSKLK